MRFQYTRAASQRERKVIIGYSLNADGTQKHIVIPASRVRRHKKVPFSYDGSPCVLYFLSYPKNKGLNSNATNIINSTGSTIYGPAILETGVETWHSIRVKDSEANIRAKIAHLKLGAHTVVPVPGRDTHRDVMAKNVIDLYRMRSALSV